MSAENNSVQKAIIIISSCLHEAVTLFPVPPLTFHVYIFMAIVVPNQGTREKTVSQVHWAKNQTYQQLNLCDLLCFPSL